MSGPAYLPADWPAVPGVRALCTLRRGGVSAAPFDSFNFGQRVGDAPALLQQNLQRLTAAVQLPGSPQWLEQVHGVEVADLDQPGPRQADAAVTGVAGVVCAIQTADCLPVLLAAVDGSAVGAAHAGWRGLAGGVLANAVDALRARATAGIALQAWLGPAIGQAQFEVGDEVRAAFCEADSGAAEAFAANARGRWQADLYALARRALAAQGVTAVSGGGCCTYTQSDDFYSYRRAPRTGRMASLVWIEPRH
jgi:hypothetical protein